MIAGDSCTVRPDTGPFVASWLVRFAFASDQLCHLGEVSVCCYGPFQPSMLTRTCNNESSQQQVPGRLRLATQLCHTAGAGGRHVGPPPPPPVGGPIGDHCELGLGWLFQRQRHFCMGIFSFQLLTSLTAFLQSACPFSLLSVIHSEPVYY